MSRSAEIIHCQGNPLIPPMMCLVRVTQMGSSLRCGVKGNSHLFVCLPFRERIRELLARKSGSLASDFDAETLAPGILKINI